jgi:hypothetical protein
MKETVCFPFALSLLYSGFVYGQADEWLCRETAAIRQDQVVLVCGVGIGKSEAEARLAALHHAKREFHEICSESWDCKDQTYVLTPLRNSCEEINPKSVKCYRGLKYEIKKQKRRKVNSELSEPAPLSPSTLRSYQWFLGGALTFMDPSIGKYPQTRSLLVFNPSTEVSLGGYVEYRILETAGLKFRLDLLSGSMDKRIQISGRSYSVSLPIYLYSKIVLEPEWLATFKNYQLNDAFIAEPGQSRILIESLRQTAYGISIGFIFYDFAANFGGTIKAGLRSYQSSWSTIDGARSLFCEFSLLFAP